MLRFGEAAFALAPLLALALIWAIFNRRVPSRRAVVLLVVTEVLIGAAVIWSGLADSLPPHESYVPARMQGGVVVNGHGG
jgi:hypothetical protein